jgi:hypothetical protein
MTDPTSNYPVTPPPPTSPWTTQDPYAPYARPANTLRSYQPYAGGPPEPPDGDGPGPDQPYEPYEPYAGGPGFGGGHGVPPGTKPPAYWPLSIVGLLFSFVFGVIALYFSAQVGRRWDRGDVEGSRAASRWARNLGIVAIVVGVIGSAILIAADAG